MPAAISYTNTCIIYVFNFDTYIHMHNVHVNQSSTCTSHVHCTHIYVPHIHLYIVSHLCCSSIAKCGEPEVRRWGREKYFDDITAHVKLSKCLSETLCLHDDLVDHVDTGEIKVQCLVRVSGLYATVCQHTGFFQSVHGQYFMEDKRYCTCSWRLVRMWP